MCALKLAREGVRVTLIEKNEIIGGHARHAEVLGGHLRNPAFGAFVEGLYPNLIDLLDELGLDKVRLCHSRDFRQNLAFDEHEIPKADPVEVARFLSDMKRIHETGKDGRQSIGDYLDANRFDEQFILYFFLGKAIHFFAGLSIEEYLEIPLSLMAWFMVADMAESNSDVFRLRNKDYMKAFADALQVNGVEILTGTAAELVSRNVMGVRVKVENHRIIDAEKLVLAIPPNAIVSFLASHLSSHERRLKEFDCRCETVVLHQDSRWVSTAQNGALFGLMPNRDDPLPSRQHTIPLTTSTFSGKHCSCCL
jgi:predicted NAD/FAD-binding protein